MANAKTPSTAIQKPPYFLGQSQNMDVYGNEKHYAILTEKDPLVVADLEGGLTPEAKACGEFIVRACNMHEDLLTVINDLLCIVVDQNQAWGNELEEREQEIYDRANALLNETNGNLA